LFQMRVRVYFVLRHAQKTVLPRWVDRWGRRARGDFKTMLIVDILGRFISRLSRSVKQFALFFQGFHKVACRCEEGVLPWHRPPGQVCLTKQSPSSLGDCFTAFGGSHIVPEGE